MNTKVKGEAIKEGSIPFSALDKNINKDISVVVGNLNEDLLNRFKYIVDNLTGDTVYGMMHFGDMCICGKITRTFSNRHQIIGVVIDSNTDKFKEGDGIRIGGGSGEVLTPLCGNYAEVTSCGLTYENTTSVDPVVWKYMCNPFKLEDGVKIPQELHNIIWDNELSELKPISCKLLITDTRIIDYIGSDYVEVSSINLRYDYNAADNTFVESV